MNEIMDVTRENKLCMHLDTCYPGNKMVSHDKRIFLPYTVDNIWRFSTKTVTGQDAPQNRISIKI